MGVVSSLVDIISTVSFSERWMGPLVPFLYTGRVFKKASVFSERTPFTLLLSNDAQDRRRDLVFFRKSRAKSFPQLPTKWLKTC